MTWTYTWKEKKVKGKIVPGKGKWDKPPYSPHTGEWASSTDAATWGTIDQALTAWHDRQHDGIGFSFSETDDYCGIDFDDCRDPKTGEIAGWAQKWIDRLASYTEVSPSGTGIKVFVRAVLPRKGRRVKYAGGEIEIYNKGRYFTTTGRRLDGTPGEVRDAQSVVDALLAEVFPEKKAHVLPFQQNGHASLGDQEIIERAKAAKNGAKFLQLWSGDASAYGDDESRADLALCSILAFWTQDRSQIDRIFRQSQLMRDKWERKDYRDDTIAEALAGCKETYQPKGAGNKANHKASGISAARLANKITAEIRFARDAGRKLYTFKDGVYCRGGDDLVKRRVKAITAKENQADEWSSRLAAEVVEYILADARELWDRPPADVVNIQNGLLNVGMRELQPHSPDHLSPIQLPIRFDAWAKCPASEKFVGEVFPADGHQLAWEIPAWLMTPDTSIQKAVLLLGEGANGKSTWLKQILAFLGKQNVSSISLHRLEANTFASARLVGKLANICPDLPSEHLAGTSVFKAITGGDTLAGEHKFCTSFEFDCFARLVFSANHPPRSKDSSPAFFRRWLVVPFSRVIPESEAIKSSIIDARLSDPKELSGVLNKALDALDAIKKRGRLSEPESSKAAWDEFRSTTDPATTWLESHVVVSPDAIVAKGDLRAAFNKWAGDNGHPPASAHGMTAAVKRLFPQAIETQRTYVGRVQWVFLGIGLSA